MPMHAAAIFPDKASMLGSTADAVRTSGDTHSRTPGKLRRFLLLLVLSVVALAGVLASPADAAIVRWTLNVGTDGGGTVTGTFDYDTVLGRTTTSSISSSNGASTDGPYNFLGGSGWSCSHNQGTAITCDDSSSRYVDILLFSGTFASPGTFAFTGGSYICYIADLAAFGACNSGTLTGVVLAPPPTITSISPSFGPNLGGTAAVITGTNFTGATSVTLGGAAASFTVVNATTINVTTPPGTIGAANVVVTTPPGSATAPGLFSYVGPPSISSVSSADLLPGGGATVTITGTNLAGATSVTFGSRAATSFNVLSANTITAVAPSQTLAGVYPLIVAVGTRTASTSMTYVNPASIAVSPASVSEDGATNLIYTVTLTQASTVSIPVDFSISGTATNGTDYATITSPLVIPAGSTTATITVNPTADAAIEANETVTLTLAAGTGYTLGAPVSATGTILNDDVPSATLSVSPAAVAEDGAPNLVYTVTLNQASLSSTSINFTVGGTATNGTDYATVTSPLVIPAGSTTGTITVNPTADATIEADETVILTLSAGAGYTVGVPSSVTGTILNDELPNLVINDVTANEGNAGITNFTFTVSINAPAGPGGVSFDIATANGSATAGVDYVASSLTNQTIPAGSTTYTFTVLVNRDLLNEPSETFFVNVTNVVNAVVVDGQGVGFIVNDDPLPNLAINDVTVTEGNSGTVNAVFTVTLSAASGQTVGVNYATADGTATQPADYTNTSGTLTFTPGQTTRTITVPVIGETVHEANETFFVNLSGATNAGIADNRGQGTITNDDLPVTVSPGSLPNGAVAAGYSQTITASGGVSPYGFSVTAGALPAGLTLASGGTLSGTPFAGGTFNFTVSATDSSGSPGPFSGTQAYTLVVAAPTIALATTPLAGGTLGAAYSAAITPASGGTAPYAYAVTAGALPGGLTLNTTTGAITSTPNALGTFNFSITATDSSTGTGPYTATQSYSIAVIALPPVVGNSTLTVAYNANATNVPLSLSGGAATSLAITSAAAHGSTNVVGTTITYRPTPGYSGSDSFAYTATNSGGTSTPATVTITVNDPSITIAASGGFNVAAGVAYSQTFTFNGGAQPWSGYQVTNLPAGLSITGTTANTVTVSGQPIQAGPFNLNVSATDSSSGNGPFIVGQSFVLTVGAPTLTLAPAAGTFNAPYGTSFSQAFTASGGGGTYTFAPTGALPAGLTFSGNTLSGTPTAPGNHPITITATDTVLTGSGAPYQVAQNYTVVVSSPVIAVSPASVPNGSVAVPYSQTFTATGGVAPYSFAVTAGALPPGVTLTSGGVLGGTPTASGAFSFTVTATDRNAQTGNLAYSITTGAPTVVLAATVLPAATAGAAYSSAISAASGGTAPYSYAVTVGALPTGLMLNASTGAITGTPTAVGTANFSITATDSTTGAGPYTATRAYSVGVNQATTTTTVASSANPSTFGQSVTFTATVASGSGTPTGTVAFMDGATTIGTGKLSGGTATLATSALTTGAHSITAVYAGDVAFTASTSAALTQTVNSASTTTTVTSSANPSVFGQSVTFTATVTSGGGTPTGNLSFRDGATTLGTVSLSAGTATFATSGLTAGAHSITAVYAGATLYTTSTSSALNQTVNFAAQVISFAKPAAQVFAPAGTLSLTATGGASGLPVTFSSNATAVCTTGGTNGATVTFVTAGTCSITANQAGNAGYAAAAPVTQTFAVGGAPTTTTLSSSSTSTLLGQPVTFTARVSVTFAAGSPVAASGNVSFTSNGSTPLCNSVSLAAGVATCTAAFTTAGTHSIVAAYAGSATSAPSTSSPVSQTTTDQRQRTTATIGKFMGARNNQILSNGPDESRQIDRLEDAGSPTAAGQSGAGFSGSSGSATSRGFAERPSQLGAGPDSSDISRMRLGGRERPRAESLNSNLLNTQDALPTSTLDGPTFNGPDPRVPGSVGTYGPSIQSNAGGNLQLNGMRLQSSFDGATRLGFATSLRDMNRAAAEAEARKIADAGLGLAYGNGLAKARSANPFDIWMQGKYTSFHDSRSNADIDGHVGLLSIGADYVFNRSLLIGTMVQFDSMQQSSQRQTTDVRGHGWMAGPYATLRLSNNVFLQMRGAWGQSDNEISPFLTYVDSFESRRWLVASTLSGRWTYGNWSFRPSASISHLEDVSKSYVDTFGTIIPEVKSRLGQAKAGPELGYRLDFGHTVIEPHAGLHVIWNFAEDMTAKGFGQIGGETTGPAGVRGRVELGARAMTPSGFGLDLSGSYDGIGSAGYSSMTGRATVRVPLN